MKQRIKLLRESIGISDWLMWGLLSSFCFICYQYGDILHTGGSSIAYLNGHILDFYDYNKVKLSVNNYMPTTYLLFAVWNIPIRVLGLITDSTMDAGAFVRMWYKLGTFLLFLCTAYLIYKICIEMAVQQKQAIMVAFLFLSNPIAIYSELIFGQYDIITAFFMCLGLLYYVRKDRRKFIIAFSLALTCKYFALLVFIPLLLLWEKNVCKIIRDVICVCGLFVIELLFYITSEAFRTGVFDFFATDYLFNFTLENGAVPIRVGLVLWILLCAFSYFKECREDEWFLWGIYVSCAVMFLCFGLSYWHPQWLLLAIPFFTLGMAFHKRTDIYMLLDFIMMGVFVLYVVNQFPHCDQDLFNGGIFRRYVQDVVGNNTKMSDLLVIQDVSTIFSLFVAVLLSYVVFLHPKMMGKSGTVCEKMEKGVLRLRYIGGCCCFIVPSLICLAINFIEPKILFAAEEQQTVEIVGVMTPKDEYEQVFLAKGKQVSGIAVDMGTYMRENHSVIKCELIDKETDAVLNTLEIHTEDLIDNAYVTFDFPKATEVVRDKQYAIRIRSVSILEGDIFTLYRTQEKPDIDDSNYAVVNGKKEHFDFCLKVYGK